jgi:hypothetical protein
MTTVETAETAVMTAATRSTSSRSRGEAAPPSLHVKVVDLENVMRAIPGRVLNGRIQPG